METNMAVYERISDRTVDQYQFNRTTQKIMRGGSHAHFSAWELLGKGWTILIITQLLTGTQSFGELATHVQGISRKVLSERLKELEMAGIVLRQVHNAFPVRVTYHLTEKGKAL